MSALASAAPGIPAESYAGLLALMEGRGREVMAQVQGGSMAQTLPDAARIRIRSLAPDELQPGIVVALAMPSGLVAHRIVTRGRRGLSRDFIITRGDACIRCDSPVNVSIVAGRVTDRWDGAQWEAVPRPLPLSPIRQALSALALFAPSIALEISPRAAQAVNAALTASARLVARIRAGLTKSRA